MKKVTTFGKIKDGKVYIWKIKEFWASLKEMRDGDFVVTAEASYNKRSTQQNRYYWGVLVPAFCIAAYETTGDRWSKEMAHDTLKSRFLVSEFVNEETGEILNIVNTTTQLGTQEFNEYIENCRNFVLEWFGSYVPSPNEHMDDVSLFNEVEHD